MSHFTTIVVCRDGDDPEELLAPYVEDVSEAKEYAEFDIEVKKEDFAKRAGELVAELKDDDEDKPEWEQLLKDKKYTEIFDKWFGGEKHLGNWGYWHNPQAKWDWYELGGRWAGYFKAKEGKTGEQGTPSWGTGEGWKYPEGYFDSINFEDIDWEGKLKKTAEERIAKFQEVEKEFRAWHDEEEKKYDFEKDGQKARDLFWEVKQKKLEEIKNIKGIDLQKDLDEIVDRIYGQANRPHAFISPDGEWHEGGHMGWWAMVTDEHPLEYREAWDKLLKESKPTDRFYAYDLHI